MSHELRRRGASYPVALPQRDSALSFGLALLAVLALQVGLALALIGQAAPAVALLAIGTAAVWGYRRLNTNGYRVSRDGLERLGRRPRGERWSWDELQAVHFERDGLRVETARGELRIGAEVPHWAALGEHLCAELDQPTEAPEAEPVPAAQIEAWLGVPPGGALTVGPPYRNRWLLLGGFGLAGFCLIGIQPLATVALWSAGTVRFLCWLKEQYLVADGQGVSVAALGTRRFIPWTALRGVGATDRRVQLVTSRGSITCRAGTPGHKLYRAASAMLAAREAGAALPRMGAVSGTALSRAAQDVAVERGLSRGEGGEA